MRKIILIASIAFLSSAANAGPSRGLSLASNEPAPASAEQPKARDAEQPKLADAPASAVERPRIAAPEAPTTTTETVNKPVETTKPKKKHLLTEARIISELHRHGIYW